MPTNSTNVEDQSKVGALLGHICRGLQASWKQQLWKMTEALKGQTNASHRKEEETVDRALRSAWFELEDVTECNTLFA